MAKKLTILENAGRMNFAAVRNEIAQRKRFKVWSRKPHLFNSLNEARAFAASYHAKTGFIVAITERN